MNEAFIRYFGESYFYIWNWDDGGEVVCLGNGKVIAYSAYIEEVLGHLQQQGWPSFGALLLGLVATGKNGDHMLSDAENIANNITNRFLPGDEGKQAHQLIKDAFKLLRVMNSLPESCKSGDTRLLALQTVFAYSHNMVSAQKAKQWLPQFRAIYKKKTEGGIEALGNNNDDDNTIWHLYADFRCLALQSGKFPDANSILEKMTGVPVIEEMPLPEQEPLLPTVPELPANLVEALEANAETMQIGSLIKHLWSGLQIPIHHNLPSEQPLGGISDLTNKGDFDKLLVSEFANDDLVLLSRLANNEALYLHREVPPTDKRFERLILIDVSLKNWGTPRLLAYALAIAIGKHPKTDLTCKVFAVGNQCLPIEYNTVDEVIASLRQMDASLHAASGIRQFFETLDNNTAREVFYIATEEAAAHPAVLKVVSDYYQYFTYFINTTAQGSITLYKKQHKGRKFIQRMEIPLESIWKKGAGKIKAPTLHIPVQELTHCPILFPASNDIIKAFKCGLGNYYVITTNKKIFRIPERSSSDKKRSQGWEHMPLEIPPETTNFELGGEENSSLTLLCFSREQKKLVFTNIHSGERQVIIFDEWIQSKSPEFFADGNTFYYMNQSFCWKFNFNGKWSMTRSSFDPNVLSVYLKRQESLKTMKQALAQGQAPVLKKLHEVTINEDGNLVLNNNHVLLLNANNIIKFANRKDRREQQMRAVFNEEYQCFVFPEGSMVTINNAGMLVLRTSLTNLPMRYDVVTQKQMTDDLQLLKEVKKGAVHDISVFVELINYKKAVVASFDTKEEATAYSEFFAKHFISLEVLPAKPSGMVFIPTILSTGLGVATDYYYSGDHYFRPLETQLLQMTTKDFYTRHIQSFITHITDHAASH